MLKYAFRLALTESQPLSAAHCWVFTFQCSVYSVDRVMHELYLKDGGGNMVLFLVMLAGTHSHAVCTLKE